jgi:hypothetical protein
VGIIQIQARATKRINEPLAAELSGIIGHHGPDTVQNVMLSAIEWAGRRD